MRQIITGTLMTIIFSANLAGQEPSPPAPSPEQKEAPARHDADRRQRYEKFTAAMSGSALVGHFTTDGKDQQTPNEERYEIRKVTKLEEGDYWLFLTRIKYGDKDLTVPVPLQVKWAGKTPVITLDNVTIPGLGTFDSRVVISGHRYAGTWQHGDVGGHLFGRIEAAKEPQPKASDP
jgi:hypothetical protein